MTTTEPKVSLQCCKSLVVRTFSHGGVRTKQQCMMYSILINLVEISDNHGRSNQKTSSTVTTNILFHQRLQRIPLSINSPPLEWSTFQAPTLEDFCNSLSMQVSKSRDCEQHVLTDFFSYIRTSQHECFKVVHSATMRILPCRVLECRFARVSNHVTDFNASNTILTAKLIHQDYRYHKFRTF